MTICYFGNFDLNYARNRVIIKGLKENNVRVLVCHSGPRGIKKYWKLFKEHRKIANKYDILIVGFAGRTRSMILFAKLISRKPIIWDAFYSIYDSWVLDRKLVSPKSLKAKYYWFLDWLCCKLADKILLDTEEHIKYFVKEFKIKKDKFIKVLVGTDDSNFYPQEKGKEKKEFIIHFHGNYIPLQGVEYIIKAAKILEKENVRFNIIGSKIKKQCQDKNFSRVNFIENVPYKKLPACISEADICLGIFGDTQKTQRVIPNKVYEAIAMEKPVITADTPAARELFIDRKNILFCKTADPEDLAEKILELKNNKDLREKIAKGGYKVFKNYATPRIVVRNLLNKLLKI